MKKRFVALFLVLVMAVCIFPASAFAAPASTTSGTIKDMSWSDGYFHLLIYNKEHTIWKETLLYNDGGVTYRSANKTAQLKLTEFSVDYGMNNINPGGTDGYFGDKTESATEAFQDYWNTDIAYWFSAGTVGVDGLIGKETWSAFSYYVHLY